MYTANMRNKITLFLLVCGMCLPAIVNAKSIDSKLEIDVQSENKVQITYSLALEFVGIDNVTNNIGIVLPYLPEAKPVVTIDGSEIQSSLDNLKVNIDLSQNPIRGNVRKNLRISYSASKVVRKALQAKVLEFLGIGDDFVHDQFTLQINYPKIWGEPYNFNIKEVNKTESESQVKLQYTDLKKPVTFLWQAGDLSGRFSNDYEINSSKAGDYLVPIPHSDGVQRIAWYALPEDTLGLYDQSGNQYFYFSLVAGEKRNVTYQFDATLQSFASVNDLSGFSANNGLVEYKTTQTFSGDDKQKLSQMFDFVVSQFSPAYSALPTREQLASYQIAPTKASSFDYCYALTSMAGRIGIPSRLLYGISVLPLTTNSPLVWCEFLVGEKVIVADPFQADLIGNKLFDEFRFGKLVFGKLNFASEFIPWVDEQIVLPTGELTKQLINSDDNADLAYEGIYKLNENTLLLSIDNFSRVTIPVNDLRIDSNVVSARTFRDFNYLLLPGKVNDLVFELPDNLTGQSNQIHELSLKTSSTTLKKTFSDQDLLARETTTQILRLALGIAIVLGAVALCYIVAKRVRVRGSI